MKVNRVELLDALEKVKPGLASKETIEQSTSFAFIGDKVVTYNDEISISHPVKGLDVIGAVKAQTLYGYLNRVKQDTLDITLEENQVIIKTGRAKAGLIFESNVILPVEEIGKIDKWTPIPDDFLPALKFCYPSCSRDISRNVLTCVHITPERMESSDSFQISVYKLSEKFPIQPFLLPASAAKELVRYNVKEISLGDSWVHFRTEEGTIFSSRLFMAEFPNVDRFLNLSGMMFTFPDTIKDILRRAEIFAKTKESADDPMVTVTLNKGKFIISVQSDHGWFKEIEKASSYKGNTIEFKVIIDFLREILDKTMTCTIGENTLGFQGDNWKHIVAMTAVSEKDEE